MASLLPQKPAMLLLQFEVGFAGGLVVEGIADY